MAVWLVCNDKWFVKWKAEEAERQKIEEEEREKAENDRQWVHGEGEGGKKGVQRAVRPRTVSGAGGVEDSEPEPEPGRKGKV